MPEIPLVREIGWFTVSAWYHITWPDIQKNASLPKFEPTFTFIHDPSLLKNAEVRNAAIVKEKKATDYMNFQKKKKMSPITCVRDRRTGDDKQLENRKEEKGARTPRRVRINAVLQVLKLFHRRVANICHYWIFFSFLVERNGNTKQTQTNNWKLKEKKGRGRRRGRSKNKGN